MSNEEVVRCLIADDDYFVADFLKEAIADPGIEASCVHNGEEALKTLASGVFFDLLITDLHMPLLNGEELLKQVRKISPQTLIIVLTGYGSINSAVSLIQQGAFDYLTKPIELHDFQRAISKALEHIKTIRKKKLRGDITKVWHISQLIDKNLSPNRLLEGILENAIKVTQATGAVLFLSLENDRWTEGAISNVDMKEASRILEKLQTSLDPWKGKKQGEINKNALKILQFEEDYQVVACPFIDEGSVVGILAILLPLSHEAHQLLGLIAVFCSQVDTIVNMAIRIHKLLHTNEEMIKTHAELERLHAELKQSAKLACIGELAASIAHDINTPLTCILGFIRLSLRILEKPSLSAEEIPQIKGYLEKVFSESNRCQEIINDLLIFARKENKTFTPFDLAPLVKKVSDILQESFEKSKIVFTWEIGSIAPILGNANQIQQVLMNLFINAKNAMPEGGKLFLKAESTEQKIKIHVVDTGKGIPPENLDKIFEPFFTTNPSGKGTGLGLSISKKIIKEHGGEVQVKSQVGVGTTFTLCLPRAKQEARVS